MKIKQGKLKLKNSFTLMEILVVCILLVILAGISIVGFNLVRRGALIKQTRAEIERIKFALQELKRENGYYIQQKTAGRLDCDGLKPYFPDIENLMATEKIKMVKTLGTKQDDGFYDTIIVFVYNDPFKMPYYYKCPGTHNKGGYDLWSWGPDQQDGTADDVKNWE